MFNDEFLNEIFSTEEIHTVPIGCQSTVIHVIEDLITKKVRENYDARLYELLSD